MYDVALANLLLPLVINQSITFHLSERKNNNKNNVYHVIVESHAITIRMSVSCMKKINKQVTRIVNFLSVRACLLMAMDGLTKWIWKLLKRLK